MIETGLVYIYSISPVRAFKGCGALIEGGYIATCQHVWRIAAPGQVPSVAPEVEIVFPRIRDGQGIPVATRASIADSCEGLEVPAPDLVLLKPLDIPAGVRTVPLARHRSSETGAGIALAGLIGLDKNRPGHLRDVPVNGEIADYKDTSGLRQFTGNKPQSFWLKPGASGSPVFLENGGELAGMVVLSEIGVNEGESHLLEAFVLPATTIIRFLGRHLAKPVANELGIDMALLQPPIDGLCAQDHVPTFDFAARLRENVIAVRAQGAKSVLVSNDGADIDEAIAASREKLGALDTAGAREVLQAKIAEEQHERVRRLVPLLKERAEVERLAFDYDAAKSTLREVTRLAPDDFWAFIGLGDLYAITGPLEEAANALRDAREAARQGGERDLSVAYIRIGDVQKEQGDLAGALESYSDSLAIRDRLAKSDPSNAGRQRDLSVSYDRIGDVQREQGDLAGALKSYNDGLAIGDRLAKSDPGNAEWQRDLSVSFISIGDVQVKQGDLAGALKSYNDSLAIRDRLAKSDPGNAGRQHGLSVALTKIGHVQAAQGDLAGALKSYRDDFMIMERLAKSDPGNVEWQCDLSGSYVRIGGVQEAQGDVAGALKSYRDGFMIMERLTKADPGNAGWQRHLSVSYERIGGVQEAQGDVAGALKSYEAGLAIDDRLVKSDPSNAGCRRDLSVSYEKIGGVQEAQGDLAGALKSYSDSFAIRDRLAKSDPSNAGWQRDLSVSYEKIGDVQVAQGDVAAALKSYNDSLAIKDRLAKFDPSNVLWQHDLIDTYKKLADCAPSERRANLARALEVAQALHATGRLAPREDYVLDDLTRRIAELPKV